MPAYKDSKQGTWYASFYFENWQGVKQKKLKRGFATKKDALAWEREFLLQQAADLTMTFEGFVEIYITDKKKRLRENTWSTKEHIIRTKILPYFKEKRLSEIKPRDVIAWQNEMLNYRDKNGKAYSPTYLKTLHGQLSAILNHAVRFYGLKSNAAATAGCMGSEKHKEMLFWTKEEYLKFAEAMMDKPQSYYAFEVLYSQRPEEWVPEAGTFETAKSYREKKAMPQIQKLVKLLFALHRKYWEVNNERDKYQYFYQDEKKATRHLSQQLEQVKAENSQLYAIKRDFGRVWHYFGAEKMNQVIGLMKEQEQTADRSQKKNRQNSVEL